MDRTACTEPQCLYKGALYLTFEGHIIDTNSKKEEVTINMKDIVIEGEHKVFPWLQTFITRKLRGIQT
jgi:hypothetical protein